MKNDVIRNVADYNDHANANFYKDSSPHMPIRLWSHRSIHYIFAIRYTICSPPQTRFRSFHATSLECHQWQRANRIANTVYRILPCDHSLIDPTEHCTVVPYPFKLARAIQPGWSDCNMPGQFSEEYCVVRGNVALKLSPREIYHLQLFNMCHFPKSVSNVVNGLGRKMGYRNVDEKICKRLCQLCYKVCANYVVITIQ